MLLAARALGLGATLTTLYLRYDKEVEAALGLPPTFTPMLFCRSATRWAGLAGSPHSRKHRIRGSLGAAVPGQRSAWDGLSGAKPIQTRPVGGAALALRARLLSSALACAESQKMPKLRGILRLRTIFSGGSSMSKPSALTLFCCLAALPLIGCASGIGPQSQTYPTAAPVAAASSSERIYAAGPGGPAAILVMLPSPGDVLTADPALWAAQGFDVVTPPPREIYQLAADREAAFDRLIASAQALADAPIWLVGPNPAIESAMASMPRSGPGEVSASWSRRWPPARVCAASA